MIPLSSEGLVRFGVFEVDLRARELRKHGIRLKVQDQPFQVLRALLERPGEVITREELHKKLWPDNTFVDFDQSLNRAINKIREALGDQAENPRFIETLARRGYRFIAPVQKAPGPPAVSVAPPAPLAPAQPAVSERPLPMRRRTRLLAWSGAVVCLAAALAVIAFRSAPLTAVLATRQVTYDGRPKSWPVLTDRKRVYVVESFGSDLDIAEFSPSGGDARRLFVSKSPGDRIRLADIAPDGQELLLLRGLGIADFDFWRVRISDGAMKRVGDLRGDFGSWSPDGSQIVCFRRSAPGKLFKASADGTSVRQIADFKDGYIWAAEWSPDGSRIRFTRFDRSLHSLWEIRSDGSGLKRVLPDWGISHGGGGWTADGVTYLVGTGDINPMIGGPWSIRALALWAIPERHWLPGRTRGEAVQLTHGPVHFFPPVPPRNNSGLFALASIPRGELQRFDLASKSWVPHLNGLWTEVMEDSHDRKWVAYAGQPDGGLWRMKPDGKEKLRLTDPGLEIQLPFWSPDDTRIAFCGRRTGSPWKIYVVPAAGGEAEQVVPGDGSEADAYWLPDGKDLLFNPFTSAGPDMSDLAVKIVNVETHKVSTMEGSHGIRSARCSPDGKLILGVRDPTEELVLCRMGETRWETILPYHVGYPFWSRDGKYIQFWSQSQHSIMRLRVRDRKVEVITAFDNWQFRGMFGPWVGWTHDNEPLATRDMSATEIYELKLGRR